MSSRRPAGDSSGSWRKSSWSGASGDCIEVASLARATIHIRDSKDPSGAVLSFSASEWSVFINSLHNGQLDRKTRMT
jgi:hypothetical protein